MTIEATQTEIEDFVARAATPCPYCQAMVMVAIDPLVAAHIPIDVRARGPRGMFHLQTTEEFADSAKYVGVDPGMLVHWRSHSDNQGR